MKKKVIKLTESDIELLVKRIIKEEGEFDWTDEVDSAPDIFKKHIGSYEELVHYGKGTQWSPALPIEKRGKKFYDDYTKNGSFTVYLNKDDNDMKVLCHNQVNGNQCFDKNERSVDPLSLFKVDDLNQIPEE